mmetsp:Transcript_13850/g.20910  ORF Transcript_13850/g.20910 Transcript_13850/m.20910 type:complete len:261 (-) Transcript_13850:340-1122(-)
MTAGAVSVAIVAYVASALPLIAAVDLDVMFSAREMTALKDFVVVVAAAMSAGIAIDVEETAAEELAFVARDTIALEIFEAVVFAAAIAAVPSSADVETAAEVFDFAAREMIADAAVSVAVVVLAMAAVPPIVVAKPAAAEASAFFAREINVVEMTAVVLLAAVGIAEACASAEVRLPAEAAIEVSRDGNSVLLGKLAVVPPAVSAACACVLASLAAAFVAAAVDDDVVAPIVAAESHISAVIADTQCFSSDSSASTLDSH